MFNIFLQPNKIIDTPIDNVYIFFNEPCNFSPCPYFLVIYVTLFSSLFFGFCLFFMIQNSLIYMHFQYFCYPTILIFKNGMLEKNFFFLSPFHCSK